MATLTCWSCRRETALEDNYCRHCGSGQGRLVPWYYKPSWIILLTLLALGPFSLVLVWRSPLLSPRIRWIYTILITVGSIYVCVKTYDAWIMLKNLSSHLDISL